MKKSNQTQFQKEEAALTMWTAWFISAFIIFFAYLFVGTLDGSIAFFPNWPYFFGLSLTNLVICLYYGFKK